MRKHPVLNHCWNAFGAKKAGGTRGGGFAYNEGVLRADCIVAERERSRNLRFGLVSVWGESNEVFKYR